MPTNKPERWEIQQVYDSQETYHSAISAISALVDERWQADEAERERGREALSIIENWRPQHADDCTARCGTCNCGLAETLAQLRGELPPDPQSSATATVNPEPRKPAEWEYAIGDTAAPWEHDVDAFNREQRARRKAYAQGLVDGDIASRKGDVPNEFCRADAAKRYPLKKREPRIMPDPHGAGDWRVATDGVLEFSDVDDSRTWLRLSHLNLFWTPLRIRALNPLLDSPFTYVDDTTPEQESA